jgi:hypothetical protein
MSDLDKFIKDLESKPLSFVAMKWVIERTPYVFSKNRVDYISWKEQLSQKIGIDGKSITFTGSSCTGFSLNPNKNFNIFDDESDIDIAIISNHYFDISWHYLRNIGAKRYSFKREQIASITDHVSRLIYWGTIATDKILEILPFGANWFKELQSMSTCPPTEGRDINIRIYKDFESLKAYHVNNLMLLRNKRFTKTNHGVSPNETILKHNS